jgi:CAS/CSE protein, C-terminus
MFVDTHLLTMILLLLLCFYTAVQVLSQDVIEFHPYVFQILAQLLELRPGQFSAAYTALFPPLMLPQLWERRGNVPALVRLVQGIYTLVLLYYFTKHC